MAALPNFRGQTNLIRGYRFDGAIASAVAPQLILPEAAPRSSVSIQNTSNAAMWLDFGGARAAAVVSGGSVVSVSVTNGGFGYAYPPVIRFMGGAADPGNGRFLGIGYPGHPAPSRPARAHAVLVGGVVTSIVVDDGGAGYSSIPPYVHLANDPQDPFGCASPYGAGAGAGYQLAPGSTWYEAFSVVATETVAVWSATVSATYACRITQ
jgi:hypothetical protein